MLIAEFSLIPVICGWLAALSVAETKATNYRVHLKKSESLLDTSNIYTRYGGVSVAFLTSSLLQSLGAISYSIYVVHYPLFYFYTWLANNEIVPMLQRDRHVYMGIDTYTQGLFALDSYQIFGGLAIVVVLGAILAALIENPARDAITKLNTNRSRKKQQQQQQQEEKLNP
jgi:peptidoglycan/LPS O-acetylase OafA/YrhL